MEAEPLGEAAICGTDASDFACGELVWIDGAREEAVLVFTSAEALFFSTSASAVGREKLVGGVGSSLIPLCSDNPIPAGEKKLTRAASCPVADSILTQKKMMSRE